MADQVFDVFSPPTGAKPCLRAADRIHAAYAPPDHPHAPHAPHGQPAGPPARQGAKLPVRVPGLKISIAAIAEA